MRTTIVGCGAMSNVVKGGEVTRTERGWAAHLCVSSQCSFRRNTLLEYKGVRIVVSTVGNYTPLRADKPDTIGCDRYYETSVFHAVWEEPYWEADVMREIFPKDEQWALNECERGSDLLANEIHENMVDKMTRLLLEGSVSND